jgi:hypothetical protein
MEEVRSSILLSSTQNTRSAVLSALALSVLGYRGGLPIRLVRTNIMPFERTGVCWPSMWRYVLAFCY